MKAAFPTGGFYFLVLMSVNLKAPTQIPLILFFFERYAREKTNPLFFDFLPALALFDDEAQLTAGLSFDRSVFLRAPDEIR